MVEQVPVETTARAKFTSFGSPTFRWTIWPLIRIVSFLIYIKRSASVTARRFEDFLWVPRASGTGAGG